MKKEMKNRSNVTPIEDPVLGAVRLLIGAGRLHWTPEMDFQQATIVFELDAVEAPYLRVYQKEDEDPAGEVESYVLPLSPEQADQIGSQYGACGAKAV